MRQPASMHSRMTRQISTSRARTSASSRTTVSLASISSAIVAPVVAQRSSSSAAVSKG